MKSDMPYICFLLLAMIFFPPFRSDAQQVKSLRSSNFNDISIIDITPSGKVWVGTPDGCAVDSAGVWSPTFDSTNSPIGGTNLQAMRSNNVTAICLYPISGVLHSFMGTTRGVAYKFGNNWDTLPGLFEPYVTGIVESSNDSLWVSTVSGVSLYNDTSLQRLIYYNTPLGADSSSISCMQSNITTSPGFAMGTLADGFFYTVNGSTFIHKTKASGGLVNDSVNCIYTDRGGVKYYIGTKDGLSIYDTTTSTSTNFTTSNGLPGNDVTTLTKDCENRLWIGTRDSGLAIYNGSTFRIFNTTNGLSTDQITSISCDLSCTCWVGTGNMGIIKIDSSLTQLTTVHLPTSITDLNESAPIRIYPQPASTQIAISIPSAAAPQLLSISDIDGREMLNELIQAPQQVISLEGFRNGVYIYQVSTADMPVYHGKLIVAR